MILIPAIDLLDGQVVRLLRGDYNQVTDYRLDPLEVLSDFQSKGARLIHVVDLNAARTGNSDSNAAVVEKLLRHSPSGIELGGGLRSLTDLERVFGMGLERAILGTAAVSDPGFLQQAIQKFGAERIIVGVDVLDSRVRISGWEEDSGRELLPFLSYLEAVGVIEIIFTEIATDGALSGPPLQMLSTIHDRTRLRIIASGGVSSLADLQSLKELNLERLVGVISGKAIYEGRLDLEAGLKLLATSDP